MNYLANSISPMEREGLDYIWFATMNNGNLIPEYTNLWTKNNFDDVYKNRYLAKTFGLIGKKERVIFSTDNGIISDKISDINISLSIEAGAIIPITNNVSSDYHDFTARKYIHSDIKLGNNNPQALNTSIDAYAVGYKTFICFSSIDIEALLLYFIKLDDSRIIELRLKPNSDIKGTLSLLYNNNKIESDIELKNNTEQTYSLLLR